RADREMSRGTTSDRRLHMTSSTPLRPRSARLIAAAALVGVCALLVLPIASATNGSASSKSSGVSYPRRYLLTTSKVGHWAVVVKQVAAHAQPSNSSKVVAMLS